jgi:REP element-mobilizing transposase RayT
MGTGQRRSNQSGTESDDGATLPCGAADALRYGALEGRVPRLPRYRRAPDSLEPGQIYHVTNRGVDRSLLFASDRDRIVFLSLLAEACLTHGVVCHAWCLMSNHYHLIVEDPRGMLSQMMHHLQFCYARYFNDTRLPRRTGPLFESRFCAELIDSTAYFHDAVAYVLLNPVRTVSPMAPAPEAYRWSSAALVCSETSPAEFAASLLAPLGGLDGVLAALPTSRIKASQERRRHRLEALAGGAWMERDRVLAGRTPQFYRHLLTTRAACEPSPSHDVLPRSIPTASAMSSQAARIASAPHRAAFTGLDLEATMSAISQACRRLIPASLTRPAEDKGDVVAYALWRFTSASAERISATVGLAVERFENLLLDVRRARKLDAAWNRALWAVEWALRWQLRAAPHRP